MGILGRELADVEAFGAPLAGKSMLECGSQQIMCCAPAVAEGSSAKDYWIEHGVSHTSVDLNGERGSLMLDLGAPIDNLLQAGSFDIVTDFGTTEHVYSFYQARRNMHVMCKANGLLFFQNPLVGHWPDHGIHYLSSEFYRRLAAYGSIEILRLTEDPTCNNAETGMQVYCIARKSGPFPDESEWANLTLGVLWSCSVDKNDMLQQQQVFVP